MYLVVIATLLFGAVPNTVAPVYFPWYGTAHDCRAMAEHLKAHPDQVYGSVQDAYCEEGVT